MNKIRIFSVQCLILYVLLNLSGYFGAWLITRGTQKRQESLRSEKPQAIPKLHKSFYQFKHDVQNARSYKYKSFIGFRSEKRNTKSININARGMRYANSLKLSKNDNIWIFGGSTIWGFGVKDKETIPYYLGEVSNQGTVNLGEQAWVSRQSLNFLLNLLSDVDANIIKKPSEVIFYDGANDTIHPCTLTTSKLDSPYIHYQEAKIKNFLELDRKGLRGKTRILNASKDIFSTIFRYLSPKIFSGLYKFKSAIKTIKQKQISIKNKNSNASVSNNCTSLEFANRVSSNLVNNWQAAYVLLQLRGIGFTAILQPSPYLTKTYKGGITNPYKDSYESIYPSVIKKAKGFKWFIDGSQWLNDSEESYIFDEIGHLNPRGNRFIAQKIWQNLQRK